MAKIHYNLSFLLLFVSCTSQVIDLKEGTFLRITKDKDKDVLLYPCSASINSIKVADGYIQEITGQEDLKLKIFKKNKIKNSIRFKSKTKDESTKEYTFELIDPKKHYWKINGQVYIDSHFSNTLKEIKEPCTNCFSKKECEFLRKKDKELVLEDFIYKDKRTVETIKGDFNNDGIEDVLLVTDIGDKSISNSEYYLLTVLLQSSKIGFYKILFESSSILPCVNCEEWSNDADYSYFDLKLNDGSLSFSTNRTDKGLNKWNTETYVFMNEKDKMILKKVTKKSGRLDDETETVVNLNNLNEIDLNDFSIYDL